MAGEPELPSVQAQQRRAALRTAFVLAAAAVVIYVWAIASRL
jgi:hypothetical protein